MTIDIEALRNAKNAVAVAEAKLSKCPRRREFEHGVEVKVVRGRKLPVGTMGTVEGWGCNEYGEYVRVRVGDDTMFLNARNVTVPLWDALHQEAVEVRDRCREVYRKMLVEAMDFVGLDLTVPVARHDYSQNAYDDTSVADYKVNPEADDTIVDYVIRELDPPGSSWGALRWSGGSSMVCRPEPGVVRVQSVTRLCD